LAFNERINLIIDVATGNARTALKNLKSDLANADGAFAKTKVASGALWDGLKANAGTAALAAGTAIAAFGAKAIGDFQDVALGAGRLRDALGVTAEEASQLQEVAGDLGVGVDAVESAIGRMNKTAGSSPEAFDEIGAAFVRNKDGSMDVIGTFENVAAALDRIPDAGKRADAAQRIFGRGWQDIAELIADGADGVRDAMAGVERQKLIDDKEIARAREFRDTLDELKGVGESVSIALGGELVDSLNDVKAIVDEVKGPVEDFAEILEDLGPIGDVVGDKITRIIAPTTNLTDALDFAHAAIDRLGGGSEIATSLSENFRLRLVDTPDSAAAFEARP
jgi:hypothetical protein